MVLLKSTPIPLGTPAPNFSLPSVDGRRYTLEDFPSAQALLVMFICNHCPYVVAVEDRIIQLQREYGPKGVQLVGICSNDPTDYPDDSPAKLLERWRSKAYGFPYLIDETQETAKAYEAVCTPDLYLFDGERRLYYHGRIDDHWQDAGKVTRRELASAVDRLLKGEAALEEQWPSMGCSIKWKK
ncbi:MAG: thioredoxin family protein [Deltaproteobacteria bacterium]|nr:thioredoxin family protein [Deltaproteobacteria bacterium]